MQPVSLISRSRGFIDWNSPSLAGLRGRAPLTSEDLASFA